jgi:hypothetical protein
MSDNLRLYDIVHLITVESDEAVRLPQIDEITCQEKLDRSIVYGRNICALASSCEIYGKVHSADTDINIVVSCRMATGCDGEAIRRGKDHLHETLAAHPAVEAEI